MNWITLNVGFVSAIALASLHKINTLAKKVEGDQETNVIKKKAVKFVGYGMVAFEFYDMYKDCIYTFCYNHASTITMSCLVASLWVPLWIVNRKGLKENYHRGLIIPFIKLNLLTICDGKPFTMGILSSLT